MSTGSGREAEQGVSDNSHFLVLYVLCSREAAWKGLQAGVQWARRQAEWTFWMTRMCLELAGVQPGPGGCGTGSRDQTQGSETAAK